MSVGCNTHRDGHHEWVRGGEGEPRRVPNKSKKKEASGSCVISPFYEVGGGALTECTKEVRSGWSLACVRLLGIFMAPPVWGVTSI